MNKNLSNKVTALYCRTSTLMQATGLDAQIRALRRYCAGRDITDYVIYEDDGVSGTKNSRPALNRMMKDVDDGKIDRVIVYSFSRYARSTSHLLKALETFKEKNIAFVSTTENIDTDTPLGVAVFSIISAISQLERDLISERVRNGLRAAIERGVKVGRKKTRPSQLIRTLRKSGLTYRRIAEIAGVSQGSVSVEMREWAKEIEEGKEQVFEGDIPVPSVDEEKTVKDYQENDLPQVEPEPIQTVRF